MKGGGGGGGREEKGKEEGKRGRGDEAYEESTVISGPYVNVNVNIHVKMMGWVYTQSDQSCKRNDLIAEVG